MQNKVRNIFLFTLASLCIAIAGCQKPPVDSGESKAIDTHAAEHGVAPQKDGLIGANIAHSTTNIQGGHTNATTSVAGFQSAADKLLSDQFFAGPRYYTTENDDFLTGGGAAGVATLTGAATTTTFGKLNWRGSTTGAATAITAVTTSQSSTHLGIIQLETGSTTTGNAGISRNPSGTTNLTLGSGQVWTQEWWVDIPTLSDGTNTFAVRVGWAQSAVAAPTDGCFAEYSSAAPASGTIICRTCASSSCTTGTGGTPPTAQAATYYRVNVNWDGTNCSCQVDGTNIGSTSSTVPTAALTDIAGIIKTAGGTTRTMLLDYYTTSRKWATPRAP